MFRKALQLKLGICLLADAIETIELVTDNRADVMSACRSVRRFDSDEQAEHFGEIADMFLIELESSIGLNQTTKNSLMFCLKKEVNALNKELYKISKSITYNKTRPALVVYGYCDKPDNGVIIKIQQLIKKYTNA